MKVKKEEKNTLGTDTGANTDLEKKLPSRKIAP